jgi:hypothetical protein
MCFSATASFAAGVILVPLGGVSLAQAWKTDRRYLGLAVFPLLFGMQQISEGVLWRSLDAPGMPVSRTAAMVFLFFAYLLWLVLSPLAVLLLEERTSLRRVFLGFTIFGGIYGLSLFVPLLINPDWLRIELAEGSIVYHTGSIYEDAASTTALRTIYAAVICLPLLVSTASGVRTFGVLVTLSVLLAFLFAAYAFTSIWCYFAAMLSAYIAFMMFRLQDRPAAIYARR